MALRFLLIGLLLAGVAPAQRGGGRGGKGGGGDMIPTVQRSKNHLDQMTEDLKLTKDQKKDVKSLMDEAQKEAVPLKEQIAKSRAQLCAAIEAGKQDDIDKAVKSHSELEAQMAAIEMKAFAGIYKMLDADQRQRSRTVFTIMPGIFHAKNWADAE